MDLGFWFKLLLVCIVLTKSKVVVAAAAGAEVENVEITGENFPILYKCSSAKLTEEFLELDNSLRLPYPKEKLDYFLDKYQTPSLFNFTLTDKRLTCIEGQFEMEIPRLGDHNLEPRLYNFTPDGYLGTFKGKEEIYFHPDNFCVFRITASSISIKACKSQCTFDDNPTNERKGGHVCIQKCCTMGQVMTLKGCKDVMGADWSPGIYARLKARQFSKTYPQFQYNYFNYHWNCSGERPSQLLQNEDDLRILSDGRIFGRKPGRDYWFPLYPPAPSPSSPEQSLRSFCVDGVWLTNGSDTYEPLNSPFVVRTCTLNASMGSVASTNEDDFYLDVYPILVFWVTLLATLIHFLTVTVHLCLWQKQQNVHGWTVFLFCASQLLLNFFLCALFSVFAYGHPERDLLGSLHGLCVAIGILHHFLLIFSFSCSTILSFDVWYKLRSKTTSTGKGRKKFLAYCSFGIAVPMLIVVIGVLMEFVIGDFEDREDNLVRPGYSRTCVIQNSWQYLFYIALTITLFFIINMTLALLTLKSLWDAMRSMQNFKDSATSATFENKAQLVGKLLVMMGAFLCIEIVLAFTSPISVSRFFIILDFYRLFHAVGLFWIFVLNKRTLAQLAGKYPIVKKVTGRFQTVNQTVVSNVVVDSTKDAGTLGKNVMAENKL